MCNSLTLTPAYGRDYKSKSALLADWDADMDFMMNDMRERNTYINKQQLPELKQGGYTHLHFRYASNTKVHVVKL